MTVPAQSSKNLAAHFDMDASGVDGNDWFKFAAVLVRGEEDVLDQKVSNISSSNLYMIIKLKATFTPSQYKKSYFIRIF